MPRYQVLYRNEEPAPEFETRELCADDCDVTARLARAELEFAYVAAALSPVAKLQLFTMLGNARSRVRGFPEESDPPFFGPLSLMRDAQTERRNNPGFLRAREKPADCGPVQLKLSPAHELRRRILSMIRSSGMSRVAFADSVLGTDPRTIQRYLAGEPVPAARRNWFERLESVRADEGGVVIIVRAGARARWTRDEDAPQVLEGVAAGA